MNAITMKKFAYFDLAGTIAPGYFITEFDLFYARYHRPELFPSVQSRHQQIISDLQSGKIGYNQAVISVIQILSGLIEDQPTATISKIADECFQTTRIFPYAEPLFAYLHKQDFEIVIITADFELLIGKILAQIPKPYKLHASLFEIQNGKFTGKIKRILNNDVKVEAVREVERDSSDVLTIAFGDTDGDIPMLRAADLGFLFANPRENPNITDKDSTIIRIGAPNSNDVARKIITRITALLSH